MTMTPARKLRYALEAAALWLLMLILKCLPPAVSSNFGGWVGRTFGPLMSADKKARINLQLALPEKTKEEHEQILKGMWDNLGRVIAEYPHLKTIAKNHTQIVNAERLEDAMKADKGAVFIGAHFANWELNTISVFMQYGQKVSATYRAPNNPWSDKMLHKIRTLGGQLNAHSKSVEGGRGMMKDLRNKEMIGILVDQKYNEGLEMPFFGSPAMTNPIFVQLAQKFGCTLLPALGKRLDGCNFEITLLEPIEVMEKDGKPRPVEDVIAETHGMLESWIKQNPEQWLWVHRRWKDNVYE